MSLHLLKRPAIASPGTEVWWASSLMVLKCCGHDVLSAAPPGRRAGRDARLLRPLDPRAVDQDPLAAVIGKPVRLPHHRKAYEREGTEPKEFGRVTASAVTAASGMVATVTRALDGARRHVA